MQTFKQIFFPRDHGKSSQKEGVLSIWKFRLMPSNELKVYAVISSGHKEVIKQRLKVIIILTTLRIIHKSLRNR